MKKVSILGSKSPDEQIWEATCDYFLLWLDTVFKCMQTLEGFVYSHECHNHTNDNENVFMCDDSCTKFVALKKHLINVVYTW